LPYGPALTVTTVFSTEHYMEIRFLPAPCRPCWLVRHDGVTLVAVDPRTTRAELVQWAVDNLSPAEQNAYRAAYNQPRHGLPLDDEWMGDDLIPHDMPPSLVMELDPSTPPQVRDKGQWLNELRQNRAG
jgi:hypothetical protein